MGIQGEELSKWISISVERYKTHLVVWGFSQYKWDYDKKCSSMAKIISVCFYNKQLISLGGFGICKNLFLKSELEIKKYTWNNQGVYWEQVSLMYTSWRKHHIEKLNLYYNVNIQWHDSSLFMRARDICLNWN